MIKYSITFQKKKFNENIQAICISHNSFDWIQTVRSALKEVIGYKDKRLILYAENDEFSGIVGLSYSLFKEYGTQNLRFVFLKNLFRQRTEQKKKDII